MINKNKSTLRIAVAASLLIVIAYAMRLLPVSDNALTASILTAIRNTIHVSLLVAWSVSLHRRMVKPQIRRLMLGVGLLLVFWLTVKTVKYEFLVASTHPIGRYMWYCYYIPMIMVPLMGLFVLDHSGKPEGYCTPRWMYGLYLPALALLLCVFTNDVHQWVFRFYNGIDHYDRDYSYGIAYFVIMAWYMLLSLYFVIVLLKKCRVSGSRKMQKLPMVIVLGAVAFWIVYALRLVKVDLTVIDCLIIAGLLESAIQSGMITSNTNYQEVFNATTVPIQVVDEDYQPHYVSAGALPIGEEWMRQSAIGTVNVGDSLLSSAPITAGRVVWQDDVRQINRLRQQLQDTREQLDKENALLHAEAEVKENRAKADEQNRLYDRIAREVEPQLLQMDALLSRIEAEPENARSILSKVCVIGSYIKRRGNLLLLGEEDSRINARELKYCIRESMENLRLGGVFAGLDSRCDGKLMVAHVVAVYDFYETVIERLLGSITAMMVNLTCGDGKIRLNIQLGCRDAVAQQVLPFLKPPCGNVTYDIMDEDAVITLTVLEGGEGR